MKITILFPLKRLKSNHECRSAADVGRTFMIAPPIKSSIMGRRAGHALCAKG